MNIKLINIIEELKNLTLLEVSELIKMLEKTFNIDTKISASPIVQTTSSMLVEKTSSTKEEIIEEKTSFEIHLIDVPPEKKMPILKLIRSITGLGLKESKEIVDNFPKIIKTGLTKEETQIIKKNLELAGAVIEIT